MQHGAVRILRAPFGENERGNRTINLVATRSGRLLSATIVGAGALERIAAYALAISQRMNVRELSQPSFPALTRAEIGQQAAFGDFARSLTPP